MTVRLLLTSGHGPAECRIALAKVLVRMEREATGCGLDLDVAIGPGDKHGPSSAIAVINGEQAFAFARRWLGSILWVAQSPVRPHHKRKNWFIGVLELPAPPALTGTTLEASDVRFETFRAGGPGGQHQNKTESAVRAIHVPSGLAVVSRDGRSQHRNKALALQRLAALLAAASDLNLKGDRQDTHASHHQLERGSPARRFEGPAFNEA